MHRRRNFLPLFSTIYSVAHKAKLLQRSRFRRVFVSCYFLYKRIYEDPLSGLIDRKPELFETGDILDIGANIGYTSCLFARALKTESKVYSFEPDGFNFDLLKEVIRQRKLSGRVVPINMAVGTSDGRIEFWHNERHHGDHRVVTGHFKNSRPDPNRTSTVPVICVDTFVKSRHLHQISFIKIDVQGYDLAVCEGMKETLLAFPDATVCVEYDPKALLELGFEPVRLLEFFRTRGYLIHVLSGPKIKLARDDATVHQFAEAEDYVDLLCSRRQLE
jgi:FkbM family methyltransferase